jgi:hypothetical protein
VPDAAWTIPGLAGRTAPSDAAGRREAANRLIAYHSPISERLTLERTAYSSQLIPVTPYILVACAEAFLRYPEMMRAIDSALPAEQIGLAGHRPGSNVNAVYLWSIANFFLLGRKAITQMDPSLDDPEAAWTVLDFWERAALAFRGDGTRQAADAGDVVRPYPTEVVDTLLAGVQPVADQDTRSRLKRFNATLVNYLFLLYFDTRVGTGDTGPYPLSDGRVLLVRDAYRMGRSDFWWSDVAADVPYQYLTMALVLDGVDVTVTDFGSAVTAPEDYLDHLVGFGLFTTDNVDRSLAPVPLEVVDELVPILQRVTAEHYRNVAAMSRDEMIRCGAHVYFTFLEPFAEVAGVADELDWTVPLAVPPPLVELISAIDEVDLPEPDPDAPYYSPLA